MYIAPLIAGTNRKAYLLHASFALKDSHCQWSSIIDFTEVQQLKSEYLHTYELSQRNISWRRFWPMRTKNDWSRDIVDRDIDWTELVKRTLDFKEVVIWSLIDQTVVIDGAEEYRAEPGSVRNAGVVRRTSFPSTVDEDRLSLDAFMLKIASW